MAERIKDSGNLILVSEYRRVVVDGILQYQSGTEVNVNPRKIIKAGLVGQVTIGDREITILNLYRLFLLNGTSIITDEDSVTAIQDNSSIFSKVELYTSQRSGGVTRFIKLSGDYFVNSQVGVVKIDASESTYLEEGGKEPTALFLVTLIDGSKIIVDSLGAESLDLGK
jgi:hypothetical protein